MTARARKIGRWLGQHIQIYLFITKSTIYPSKTYYANNLLKTKVKEKKNRKQKQK